MTVFTVGTVDGDIGISFADGDKLLLTFRGKVGREAQVGGPDIVKVTLRAAEVEDLKRVLCAEPSSARPASGGARPSGRD